MISQLSDTAVIELGLILAILGGMASLGILIFENRTSIQRLRVWAFGHTSELPGVADDVESLTEKLARIESKLDKEREARAREHAEVQKLVEENRYMFTSGFTQMHEAISDAIDDDLDYDPPANNWNASGYYSNENRE